MTVPKMMLKAQVVLLFFAVVLYGQNALAIAIAQSNAYYDWNKFIADSLIANSGEISWNKDKNYTTTYFAGYGSYNNPAQYSPTKQTSKTGGWSEDSGNTARSRTDNLDSVPGGQGSAYSSGGKIAADMWAMDGTGTHGTTGGTGAYAGASKVDRSGSFKYIGTDGTLTFAIDYYLLQKYLVDNVADIASAASRFDFTFGPGTSYSGLGGATYISAEYSRVFSGTQTVGEVYTTSGNIDEFNSSVSGDDNNGTNTIESTAPVSAFGNYIRGTLTMTINGLVNGSTYYLDSTIFSTGYAASNTFYMPSVPSENDFPPVPEPCTLALFGAGMAGLGFVRKRFPSCKQT